MAKALIKPKKIIICRGEGPIELCGKKHEFTTYEEAYKLLSDWALMYDQNLKGADKVDFEVIFEDGAVYQGTYMLRHFDNDSYGCRIENHMYWYLGFYACDRRFKPDSYSDENWEAHCRMWERHKGESVEFMTNYDFGSSRHK